MGPKNGIDTQVLQKFEISKAVSCITSIRMIASTYIYLCVNS